jgi:hypothetical protein
LGKTLTEAAKEKVRQSKIGKPLSEETRAKIALSRLGKKRKPFTAEHRANISLAKSRMKQEIAENLAICDAISAAVEREATIFCSIHTSNCDVDQ